jgi:cobyrinic acid a,c-diamide synthase
LLSIELEVRDCFWEYKHKADIVVIEGVMGLFDGRGLGLRGSSAELAIILKTPVVLVIDASGSARSLAALIQGFKQHHRFVKVAAVFLNKVGSQRHLQICRQVIERFCGLPVVGYLEKKTNLMLASQHLGLMPPKTEQQTSVLLAALRANQTVDVQLLFKIAKQAPEVTFNTKAPVKLSKKVKIGVAYDEQAFFFVYEDNFKFWQQLGAELLFFNPIKDNSLPSSIQGLYFPGGYPELYAKQLAANKSLLKEIRQAVASGIPTYAECGGLLYLAKQLHINGNSYPLAGVVPAVAVLAKQRQALGYVTAQMLKDNLLGEKDQVVRGHRFHWSKLAFSEDQAAYLINGSEKEGYAKKNLLASFVHLNWRGFPMAAQSFLNYCQGG